MGYYNNNRRNNGNKHNTRTGNGYHSGGAAYVWKLSWWNSNTCRDCMRTFTSKVAALRLKAKLEENIHICCIDLTKYYG
jgi:hypothetical protein